MIDLQNPPIKDSILYYPYINLPQQRWVLHAVLYYDNVAFIVPRGYKDFSRFTNTLMESALATPVYPNDHIDYTNEESDTFKSIITHPEFNVKEKTIDSHKVKLMKMYSVKFNERILTELQNMGLAAKPDNNEEVFVEESTANVYMQYLATRIGIKLNLTPTTNTEAQLDSIAPLKYDIFKSNLYKILDNIFPVPIESDLEKIRSFKDDHYEELKKLRRKVETCCLVLPTMEENLQAKYLENLIQEATTEAEGILKEMEKSKFKKIVSSGMKVLPAILTAKNTGGLSLLDLIPASIQAMEKDKFKENPFYYAALLQRNFI